MQNKVLFRWIWTVLMLSLEPLLLARAASAREALRAGAEATLVQGEDIGSATKPVEFEGFVLEPDGAPAERAVVVSSAGGRTVTDWSGRYRLEVQVRLDAHHIQITAVGAAGENLLASTSVALPAAPRLAQVDPLWLARGSACQPSWLPTFGGLTNGAIQALAVYDDGGGPALHVGGAFTSAGGVAANYIAKWDGSNWAALGSGTNSTVHALAVHDDGSGTALYAGGTFTSAGGVAASYIAKWDGSSWPRMARGMNRPVFALTGFDDGSGPALYAGGNFTAAGGRAASSIAKWNGSAWAAVGTGMNGAVMALAVYDDGSGPALHAGGEFTAAGGVAASRIARWNGSSWAALGSGLSNDVRALKVFIDGGGPALYAGGQFTFAGGAAANRIAKWDGSSWTALGSGMDDDVRALAVHDDGRGPALHAGGGFVTAGGVAANRIARWDGSNWTAHGSAINGNVQALAAFDDEDDDTGPALYAGGSFTNAGSLAVSRIAKWDGSSWAAVDSGMNGIVHALSVYDDGGGSALYAAGGFTIAGGVAANYIAKWDGSSWAPLGIGLDNIVQALAVYDDGRGPALYVGGRFTIAGSTPANRIARWDGSSWAALGSGMGTGNFPHVLALTVYDDGGGPALYAGGLFTIAGDVGANRIAKWDGSSWAALGSGMNTVVHALAVHDDGGGPALFAGGAFRIAGGVGANHVAKWDGSSWAPLGSGTTGFSSTVHALTIFDDGSGPALYAGGSFRTAGGLEVNRIAKWDGSRWSTLGSGMNDDVHAFAVFDGLDRGGPDLIAGGAFTSAAGGAFTSSIVSGDSFLARWRGCPDTTAPVLACPAAISVSDSGSPGEIVTFTITASDDRDPSPSVVCEPTSGSLFPPGVTLVHCKATDGARNQSTCSFPVSVQRKQGQ